MPSYLKGLLWIVGAMLVAVAVNLATPWLAAQMPWSWEVRVAKLIPQPSSDDICARPSGMKALNLLVRRIYPIFPYDHRFSIHVQIVRGPTVNAFASLGGQIFVYHGLLKTVRSPDELAGILAHEIEHVRRRHIIRGVAMDAVFIGIGGPAIGSFLAAFLFTKLSLLGFSRSQERQADLGALIRLKQAHVSAKGFADFFKRLEKTEKGSEMLSDHPGSSERFQMAERFIGFPSTPIMSPRQWQSLKHICKSAQ